MSKEEAGRIAKQELEILQRIRRENLSFDEVNHKLDSIKQGVDEIRSAAAPRELTLAQRTKLRGLTQSLPEGSLSLFFTQEDQENARYSKEFVETLALSPKYVFGAVHSMPPSSGCSLR